MRGFLARGILSLRTLDWGSGAENRVVPRASSRVLGQKGSFAADVPQFCVSVGCAGGRGGQAPACAFWTFYSIVMCLGLEKMF